MLEEGDGRIEEFLERLVVLVLFHFLLVELPQALDEIKIGSVRRNELQKDVELFRSGDRSMVVLCIVEENNDLHSPIRIVSTQLFQKCFHHKRVTVVLRQENCRVQRERIERTEDGQALSAAVARDIDGVFLPLELPLLPILAVVRRVGGVAECQNDLSLPCPFDQAFDLGYPSFLELNRRMPSGDQLGLLERCREFFLE